MWRGVREAVRAAFCGLCARARTAHAGTTTHAEMQMQKACRGLRGHW